MGQGKEGQSGQPVRIKQLCTVHSALQRRLARWAKRTLRTELVPNCPMISMGLHDVRHRSRPAADRMEHCSRDEGHLADICGASNRNDTMWCVKAPRACSLPLAQVSLSQGWVKLDGLGGILVGLQPALQLKVCVCAGLVGMCAARRSLEGLQEECGCIV